MCVKPKNPCRALQLVAQIILYFCLIFNIVKLQKMYNFKTLKLKQNLSVLLQLPIDAHRQEERERAERGPPKNFC